MNSPLFTIQGPHFVTKERARNKKEEKTFKFGFWTMLLEENWPMCRHQYGYKNEEKILPPKRLGINTDTN